MLKGDASARITAGLVTIVLIVVAILVSVSGRIVLYGRMGRTVIDDPWQVWSFVALCLSGALHQIAWGILADFRPFAELSIRLKSLAYLVGSLAVTLILARWLFF